MDASSCQPCAMPCPPTTPATDAARTRKHRRTVVCDGYQREDGLWDIEGHLLDRKTYVIDNQDRGGIAVGEPLHEMRIVLTVDDDFVIRAIRCATQYAPFKGCPEAASRYQALVGLRIGQGWMQRVRERLAVVDGCTHLTELLQYLGTAAFQTIFPLREDSPERPPPARPLLLNSCHGFRADGPVTARKWPQHYRPAERSAAEADTGE